MTMGQEATLLHVPHKAPDGNVIQDKLKVIQLLYGLSELVHLHESRKKEKHHKLGLVTPFHDAMYCEVLRILSECKYLFLCEG